MVNRVTGMVSGMDTEGLVKAMMTASQTKYDNLYKKKVEADWKKTLYNDIYKQAKELHTKLFDYSMSSKTSTRKATSSDQSVVTVSASANASNASHTLKVTQLASTASVGSSNNITVAGGNNGSIASQLGIAANTDITLKINDKDITINSDSSINDLVSAINSSGAGVNASYDSNTDKFYIVSKETGTSAKIDFGQTTSNEGKALINALNLQNVDGSKRLGFNPGQVTSVEGNNAKFEFDGFTREQTSNSFTMDGISYELKSVSNATSLITVSTDTDAIVDNVKSLIETYNNLMSMLKNTTKEKYYRDFGPLTTEQKNEMTEKEIELWEEKAKSGLLRNDSTLTTLASKMRTAMMGQSSSVDGRYNSLANLGISTTSYSDQGVLTVNEDKLRNALADDPDAVQKLFGANDGFIKNLRDELQNSMNEIENKSGAGRMVDTTSTLYKQIYKYESQLSTLASKMTAEESRYYKQFSAMEAALNKLNSQNSSITSLLGSS